VNTYRNYRVNVMTASGVSQHSMYCNPSDRMTTTPFGKQLILAVDSYGSIPYHENPLLAFVCRRITDMDYVLSRKSGDEVARISLEIEK